jgi:hypothetical protein
MDHATITMFSPSPTCCALFQEIVENGNLTSSQAYFFRVHCYNVVMKQTTPVPMGL